MSRLLNVSEAAKYLGVSTKTLRRWDTDGRLVARRDPMNGYRLYDVRDLDALREGSVRPRGVSAFGRDAEIAALRARIALGGCVVCGAAGIGKSTLVRAAFPEIARLRAVADWETKLAAIEEPTWIEGIEDAAGWAVLRAHRDRPWIVVARGACPPDLAVLTLGPLGASAAEALLTDTASAMEAPSLAEEELQRVLELFGGHPLALGMIAPLLAALPTADVLRRVGRHEIPLVQRTRDTPPHHASLDAAVDASLRGITPCARRLLELLSLHDREVERDVLRAMLDDRSVDPSNVDANDPHHDPRADRHDVAPNDVAPNDVAPNDVAPRDDMSFEHSLAELVRAGLATLGEGRGDRVAAERATAWSLAPRASSENGERFVRHWLDRARRGDLRGAPRHVLRAARLATPERCVELFAAAYPLWLDREVRDADEIVAWLESTDSNALHAPRAIVHALRGRTGRATRVLESSAAEHDPFAHALATLYLQRGARADAAAAPAAALATTPEQRSWVAEAHLFVRAFGPSGSEERALLERHTTALAPLAFDTWRLDVGAAPSVDHVEPFVHTLQLDHPSSSRRALRAMRVARAWLQEGASAAAVELLKRAVVWGEEAGEAVELRVRLQKVRAHLLATEPVDALEEAERARTLAADRGAEGERFEALALRGLASAWLAPMAARSELDDAMDHAAPSLLPRQLVEGWRRVVAWPRGEVPCASTSNVDERADGAWVDGGWSGASTAAASSASLAHLHRSVRAAWRDSVEGRLTFALVMEILDASSLPRHSLVLGETETLDGHPVPTSWAQALAALVEAGGVGLDTEQLVERLFDGADAEGPRRVYAAIHGLRTWGLPIRHEDGAYRLACRVQLAPDV